MKPKKTIWIATFAAVCFLLFTATACKKTTAPASNVTNQTTSVLSVEETKQQRLAWNLKTLVEPYEQAGHINPKWDEPAKLALTEFARARADVTDTNEPWAEIISTNVATAVQAGCDDPMVNYLFIKYALDQTNSKESFTTAFCKMAKEMQNSSYPEIRKFYACFRTAQQIQYTWGTSDLAEENYFWNLAVTNLGLALQDKSMPVLEVDEACNEAADKLLLNKYERNAFYYQVEWPLFNNWTNASICWLLKGQYYIETAWAARGRGYANEVTSEGRKSFNENLEEAEKSLAHAWELNSKNPSIPIKMLTVELGQGKSRDQMELWFGRAMALDTNCYDACYSKLYYLEPKWHGSKEDMLEFGRECVRNEKWGGRVPLILMDAHNTIHSHYIDDSEKDGYWKRPEVWADIKASFDRFFDLNPDDIRWYHAYALHAYHAEQWDTLNIILPKLGPINYDYFGGKDEFDKMVRLAKEHASKP